MNRSNLNLDHAQIFSASWILTSSKTFKMWFQNIRRFWSFFWVSFLLIMLIAFLEILHPLPPVPKRYFWFTHLLKMWNIFQWSQAFRRVGWMRFEVVKKILWWFCSMKFVLFVVITLQPNHSKFTRIIHIFWIHFCIICWIDWILGVACQCQGSSGCRRHESLNPSFPSLKTSRTS